MIFEYSSVLVRDAETGDPGLILRPEVSIRVIGPADERLLWALVDTGADNTILPMSVAEQCGIATVNGTGPMLEAYGGQKITTRFGNIAFELRAGSDVIRWQARVQFFDFDSPEQESIVLGHADFLDYFTATFDGLEGILTLLPNEELPKC